MTKILSYLILTSLFFIGSCAGVSSSPSSDQEAKRDSNVASAGVNGLYRVGDSPPVDSTALTLQCVDEQTCWINSPRILWRSLDGGKMWKEIFRTSEDEEIYGVDFVQANIGWYIDNHRFVRTEDGGHRWTQLSSKFEFPKGEARSLWFLNDGKTGWLAGGTYRPQTSSELKLGVPNNAKDVSGQQVLEESIFQTRDGGLTWKQQPIIAGQMGRILHVQFVDQQRGIALGEHEFYYTQDAGNRWLPPVFEKGCSNRKYLSDNYEASPSFVAMLDAKLWWISYDDGRIIRTIDGGQHWCDLIEPGKVEFDPSASRKFFLMLHFKNANDGWGLGWDRFLYETKDGGVTWIKVNSEIRFFSVAFPSNDHAILLSESGIYRF